MKRQITAVLCAVVMLYGMTACGAEKDSVKVSGTEQTKENVEQAVDDITYRSKIISLGTYKGLTYQDGSGRIPTDQEVEEEMQAILLWYEDGELTDEWVKKQLGLNSVDEFREITRQNLQDVYDRQAWKDAAVELYSAVMDDSEFEMDEAEVEEERDAYIESYRQMAENMDMSYEQYIQNELGISADIFEKNAKESAEQVIKVALIADAVAKAEHLDVVGSYDEIVGQIMEEEEFDSVDAFEQNMGGKAAALEEVRYRLVAQFMMDKGLASK